MLRNFLKEHKIPDKKVLDSSNDQPNTLSNSPIDSPAANSEEAGGDEQSMMSVNSMRCHEMRDQYQVVPGSSWGTMTHSLTHSLTYSFTCLVRDATTRFAKRMESIGVRHCDRHRREQAQAGFGSSRK